MTPLSGDLQNSYKKKWDPGRPTESLAPVTRTHNLSSSAPSWTEERPLRFATINLSFPTLKELKDIQCRALEERRLHTQKNDGLWKQSALSKKKHERVQCTSRWRIACPQLHLVNLHIQARNRYVLYLLTTANLGPSSYSHTPDSSSIPPVHCISASALKAAPMSHALSAPKQPATSSSPHSRSTPSSASRWCSSAAQ